MHEFFGRNHEALDLTDQGEVNASFDRMRPLYVFLAAARVGGIHANDSQPADFIRDNLQIQTIVFDASKPDGTPRKLLDTSRINGLGWQPRISLCEGLAATYTSGLWQRKVPLEG